MIDAAAGLPMISGSDWKDAESQRNATSQKRICLVIEGRLLRDCIGAVLQRPDRTLHSECKNLKELLANIEGVAQPHLIMVSFARSDMILADERRSSFETLLELRAHWPETHWIVLSCRNDLGFIRDGLKSGVNGFIPEDSPVEMLRLITEMVLLGHSPLPAEIARLLAGPSLGLRPLATSLAVPPQAALPVLGCALGGEVSSLPAPVESGRTARPLSSRELDILRCLARGLSNKGIARELTIAEATVKAHVKALLRKMQVGNRTQAAICATEVLSASGQRWPIAPPPFAASLRGASLIATVATAARGTVLHTAAAQ